MSTEFKNAKVIFSNMRNKVTKDMFSKEFSIAVPSDCEQIKQLQADFDTLEKKAQAFYGEREGKKVKPASREKGVGAFLLDDTYDKDGTKRLKFIVYNIREQEVKTEDGKVVKKLAEVLSPLYPKLNFCYRINNNGSKEYVTDNGTPWLPLSENIINVKCSLRASYNKNDNRVVIRLRADDVEIVTSNYTGKGKSSFLSLDGDDTDFEKEVEVAPKVEENEIFDANDLANLDV